MSSACRNITAWYRVEKMSSSSSRSFLLLRNPKCHQNTRKCLSFLSQLNAVTLSRQIYVMYSSELNCCLRLSAQRNLFPWGIITKIFSPLYFFISSGSVSFGVGQDYESVMLRILLDFSIGARTRWRCLRTVYHGTQLKNHWNACLRNVIHCTLSK